MKSYGFKNNFVEHRDDTIIDKATGLMWQKGGSKKKIGYNTALKYLEDINAQSLAGHSDWRIPTVDELASLNLKQGAKKNLHLSPKFGTKQYRCWTDDHNMGGYSAYGLDENYQDSFIENKLLKKLNLLNDKGQLVNRQGQRVDVEGNLLDEEGARIDADGNRIDINNNPLLDDSVVDELEFEDDLAEDIEKEEKPTKKSRTSAKKSNSKESPKQ